MVTPALAGLVVWLLVVVTTACVTATLPPGFNATARIRIEPRPKTNDITQVEVFDSSLSRSVIEHFLSFAILERAAEQLKLQNWQAGLEAGWKVGGQLSQTDAAVLLRSATTVRQYRNTGIFEVECRSGSAADVANMANAVVKAFEDYLEWLRDQPTAVVRVSTARFWRAELIDRAKTPLRASGPNVPLNTFLGLVVGGVSGGAATLFVSWMRRRAGIAAPSEGQRRSRLVIGAAVVLIIGVPFVVILGAIRAANQAERQRAFAVEKALALALAQKAEPTNSLAGSADTFVTILTPDGRPATGAEVAMVRSGEFATLVGERFSDADLQDGRRVQTYNDGRFRLPLDDRLERIFAVHASGFAEAKPGQLAGQTHWALQPWGRIEGRLTSGDQPVVGRDLAVEPLEGSEAGPLRFRILAFKTETDPDGRFHFEHVTPGRVKLTRLLRSANGGLAPGHSTEVEVRHGAVTTVALGVSGHRLTGQLVWPAEPKPAPNWQFVGRVHTPIPGPPAGVGGDPVAFERWRKSPEQQKLIKAGKRFPIVVQQDDKLFAEEIEPGTYQVDFFAYVDPTAEANSHLMVQATADPITITVPAEPATGTIDIGVITLRLVPPRPR